MGDTNKEFLDAYYSFRESVDMSGDGILPDLSHLIWCLLMGIPEVPADGDKTPEGALIAIEQRTAILKAVFVEANRNRDDMFLDQGLSRYDQARELAKRLLKEEENLGCR